MKFHLSWLKSALRILILILLLVVTTSVFIYFDKELDLKMSLLKADILTYLEKTLKHKISYTSISPSIFMYLEIRDLTFYNDTNAEIFTFKKVRISYNIFTLIMDRDPLKCISAIEIANTLFEYNFDTTRPGNLAPDPGGQLQQINTILNLLKGPYNFVLKGNMVDVILTFNGNKLELSGLFFDVKDHMGDFDFKINKADIKLDAADFFGNPLHVSSKIRLNGTVADKFQYSDLLINVQYLTSNYINLEKQTLQLIYGNDRIEVRKIQDKAAIDLLLVYDFATGLITASFLTENFRPEEFAELTGPFKDYAKWMKIKLTCNGDLSFTPGKDDLVYAFKGHLALDKSISPVDLEIDSKLDGNAERVNFNPLFVKTGIGSFEFAGNLLFENLFPEGIVELFNVRALPGKELNAAFDVIRKSDVISLHGSRLVFGSTGFDMFNVDLYPAKNALLFDLEASLAGIRQDNLFKTHGTITFGKMLELDLNGNLTNVPVNMIYKLVVSQEEYSETLFNDLAPYQATTAFTVSPRPDSFSINLDGTLTDPDQHALFKGNTSLGISKHLDLSLAGNFDRIALHSLYKLLVRGNGFSWNIYNGLLPFYISTGLDFKLHLEDFSPAILNNLALFMYYPGKDSLDLTLDGILADTKDHEFFRTRGTVKLDKQMNINLNGKINDVPAAALYQLFGSGGRYSQYTYENLKPVLVNTDFQLGFNFADFSAAVPGLKVNELADIAFYQRKDSLNLSLDSSLTDTGQNEFFAGHTEFHYTNALEVDMTASLISLPPDFVYKLLMPRTEFSAKLYTALANYRISSVFKFFMEKSGFKLTTSFLKLVDTAHPDYYLQCRLDISDKEFAFTDMDSNWFGIKLLGKCTGSTTKTGTVLFSAGLELDKIPYSFNGIYTQDKTFFIKGNYGFYLNAGMAKNNDLVFYVLAQHMPLPLKFNKSEYLNFSFNLNGVYTHDEQINIVSPRIIVYDLQLLEIEKNSLQVACTVNNEKAVINDAVYMDAVSVLRGTGSVLFPGAGQNVVNSILNLNNKNNNETYKIDLKLLPGQIDTQITFNSAPLERLGDLFIKGSISGNARLQGESEQPGLHVTFQLDRAKISSDVINMNGEIDINRERIDIVSFGCNYLNHRITNAEGLVNFSDGACSAAGDYSYKFFKNNISLDLQIKGSVENIDPEDYLDSIWNNDFTASVAFRNILVDDVKFNSWSFNLSRDWNEIQVSGGPANAFKALIDLRGNFNLKVSAPFPVRAVAAGKLADNQIFATVKDLWLDLKILNVMLGGDMLKFVDGYGVGKDIIIQGPINDPDYIGSGRVNDVRISFFLLPETSEPFSSNILFEKKILSLINARTQIGKGSVLANGFIEIDHWFPKSYDISVQSDTTNGVRFAYEFEPIIVDGYAIGQVRVRANEFDIWVDGTLKAEHCNLQLNNKKFEQAAEEDAANLHIDLDFISGNNVEFHLPTVTLPLINCYANQGSRLHCVFESEKNELQLTGKVLIQGGEVFYFDRNFFLKSGFIVFNEKGGSMDPRLTVEAEIKEIDAEGETITISLIIQDKRLSEFEPYFKSFPNKSQDEIMAILSGSISEKFTGGGLGGLAMLSSDIASQLFFIRPLERNVQEALNLDMFSIRMPILKNIIEEKLIHDEPLPPGNSSTVFSRYFDNTTITLGQYLGNYLFLSGMVRLRDIESLPDEDSVTSSLWGLVPELEIGLEWETPFFNLEYVFSPKLNHIDDLFLQDNALKFEKSFSY